MSERWTDDVRAFREAVGLPVGTTPAYLPDDSSVTVIVEEYVELMDAIRAGDLAAIAKESADVIVTVIGNCQRCGIDLGPVWDAVLADNLRKVGGPRRADGKVLKPPGFVATPIGPILDRQPPLGQPAATPDAGRLADEWIERWSRRPCYGWFLHRTGDDQASFRHNDVVPALIWDRLKSETYGDCRDAGTRQNNKDDLRQALVSLVRDGIPLPELVTSETGS